MSKRSKPKQKSPQGPVGKDPTDVEDMLFAPQTATEPHPSGSAWEPAGGAWDAKPDLDDLDVYMAEAPARSPAVRDTLAEELNAGRRNPLRADESKAADEMAQTIGAARVPSRPTRPTEEVRGRRGGVLALASLLVGFGTGGFLFARGVDPVLCGIAAGLGVFAAVIVKLVGRG